MRDIDARDRWSELLWRTWGCLGVSTWDRRGPRAVVDPECLIVLTESLGDLRLARETIDWGILHAHLLSPHRLRHLALSAGVEAHAEAWISTVAASSTAARWRSSTQHQLAGYMPSGDSRACFDAPIDAPAIAALQHRAFVGAAVRGEVVRALHGVARGVEAARTVSEVARKAATSNTQASSVLTELVAAGIVQQHGSPRRRRFAPRIDHAVARGIWQPWRELAPAPWREAVDVMPLMLEVLRAPRADPATVAPLLERYDAQAVSIQDATGASIEAVLPGASATVLDQLHSVASTLMDAFTARLDEGMPNTAAPAASHSPSSQGQAPWSGTSSWSAGGTRAPNI